MTYHSPTEASHTDTNHSEAQRQRTPADSRSFSSDGERKNLAGNQILGSKRNYPFEVHQQTVNPADVFSAIQCFTQADPNAKKPKLSESTSSLLDFIESRDALFSIDDFDIMALESAITGSNNQPKEEKEEKEENEPIGGSTTEPLDDVIESVPPPPTLSPPSPLAKPVSSPVKTLPYSNTVKAEMSFGKRGNGNQPWQSSGVTPSKIGKMRRISFTLSTPSEQPLLVTVRGRVCDDSPDEHKGRLVLCQDDRCCVKRKVEGKRKPVIQCKERLTELQMPAVEISASQPRTIQFFLKPEWNGLGAGKSRPCFDVVLELIDCQTNQPHELLSWSTELQSHKFESSAKAKSLEKGSPSSISTTLSL